MPERISIRLSEYMPERMSERMSEYTYSICIYIYAIYTSRWYVKIPCQNSVSGWGSQAKV